MEKNVVLEQKMAQRGKIYTLTDKHSRKTSRQRYDVLETLPTEY